MPAPDQAVRVIVQGRVQSVWFRGWTVETARALGLRGWVRNENDGSVEAVLAGRPADVAEMIEHCHRGPPAARVQSVTVGEWPDEVARGFHQLPNAT